MNVKQAYALRADAVHLMHWAGFKIRELAIILKTTPEKIRQLKARGARQFRQRANDDNFNRPDSLRIIK